MNVVPGPGIAVSVWSRGGSSQSSESARGPPARRGGPSRGGRRKPLLSFFRSERLSQIYSSMEFKTGTTDVPGAFPFASEAYRGDPDAWAARRAEVGAATPPRPRPVAGAQHLEDNRGGLGRVHADHSMACD